MVVLATRGRPLAATFPAHCTLNGRALPLAFQDKRGTRLVGVVPQDQANVAPAEFGEQAKNPVFGAPYTLRDLSRGMGQRRQRKLPNGRYWYALNARTRSGRAINGPAITTYTPGTRDTTNGITRWFEIGGRIFALNGRYALSGGTDGTGWTVSKDFGAAKAGVDVIVVQDNHSSSARYALVAMGDSEPFWYFDGATATTTWTQTTGGDTMYARAWAVDAGTLYRIDDTNRLNTCDLSSDILTAANWAAGTDRIGTKDHAVTRMAIDAAGGLAIAKADDLYTLNDDGSINRLYGSLQFPPSSLNGEVLTRWGNSLFTTYGSAHYRLAPDGGLTQIGPELLKDNGAPVSGFISAAVGTDYFMLAALYSPDSGDSYLLEFTGELVEDEFGRPEPVWHGSICAAFEDVKITSLHTSTIGAPTGHKMAYIGLSDGRPAKYVLACTPDPADCDQEVFSTAEGRVYHSRCYFNFPGERKAVLSAAVEGDNISSTNYAQVSYRTSDNATYLTLNENFDAGERNKVQFPDSTSCVFMDTLLSLFPTASTGTPQISGLSLDYQLRTLPQEVLLISVPAEDALRQRDGTPYWLTAADIRSYINTLAGFAGGVPFVDPDGESHQVIVRAPRHATAWYGETMQPVDAIQVELVEQQPNETRGAWANLELLTWEQWEAYEWAQLEEL